jgi:drug/metabolite transporter (DMT)-like permease
MSRESWSSSGPRAVALAFGILVVIGGSNAVAVRFSNVELPPFWGAGLRFGTAALIFWIIVLARQIALPRGRSLGAALLYGLLAVGGSYAFLYWGLLRVQASLTMVVLAFVPLLTLFLAWAHGLESLGWRRLLGTVVALVGILIVVGGALGTEVPAASLLALFLAAACIAEGAVVFKLYPQAHPVATNALAVSSGAVVLIGLSLVTGEVRALPSASGTWVAFAYLVVIGTVVLFYLYLFVLGRWTASATAYSFLLFPVATVPIAALVAGEVITPSFVVGGALGLFGVWLGAVSGSRRAATSEAPLPGE